MKVNTKQRKKATAGFRQMTGNDHALSLLTGIINNGKQALDAAFVEMGKLLAESIMLIEREERAGPDYHPSHRDIQKWAHEMGSVYIADQKIKVAHPRLRSRDQGELGLQSYQMMREPGQFSEELFEKVLRGISEQKYKDTVLSSAQAFGVSSSSTSKKLVELTAQKLKDFKERDLSDFTPFAMFIDTIHRGGEAFLVALGIDTNGTKMALGFWQGSSENHVICDELLDDLDRCGLKLTRRVIFVTDVSSSGAISAGAEYGQQSTRTTTTNTPHHSEMPNGSQTESRLAAVTNSDAAVTTAHEQSQYVYGIDDSKFLNNGTSVPSDNSWGSIAEEALDDSPNTDLMDGSVGIALQGIDALFASRVVNEAKRVGGIPTRVGLRGMHGFLRFASNIIGSDPNSPNRFADAGNQTLADYTRDYIFERSGLGVIGAELQMFDIADHFIYNHEQIDNEIDESVSLSTQARSQQSCFASAVLYNQAAQLDSVAGYQLAIHFWAQVSRGIDHEMGDGLRSLERSAINLYRTGFFRVSQTNHNSSLNGEGVPNTFSGSQRNHDVAILSRTVSLN